MRNQNKCLKVHTHAINTFFYLRPIYIFVVSGEVKNLGPNLNRRTGCAGLDGQHLNNWFSNGKLVIPYSKNTAKSGSEDENVSVTISESTFNMKLSNHPNNLDLNDHLVMKSLRQGLHIEELDTSSASDTSEKHNKDYGQEKRCRSGRESHSSRRSKRSKQSRKKYSSHSDSCDDKSDSSSCPEIKQLVQSSLNSGTSVCGDKNRSSRQSKTSIDVAVQANAHDIVSQTAAYDLDLKHTKKTDIERHKSKQMKTKENKKYKRASRYGDSSSTEKMKSKYRNCGSSEEKQSLYRDLGRKYSDYSDQESLVPDKYKINVLKSKEG